MNFTSELFILPSSWDAAFLAGGSEGFHPHDRDNIESFRKWKKAHPGHIFASSGGNKFYTKDHAAPAIAGAWCKSFMFVRFGD